MALTIRTERKTSPAYNQDPRVRAIDELQRISAANRDDFLGQGWFDDVEDDYNLAESSGKLPSFRPRVNIPQLQVLNISEATELSDSSPRIYIYDTASGKVDDQRMRVFDEQWRKAYVNYYLMHAILWAQFGGIGYMQQGFDPTATYGLGEVWSHHRHPGTVYPDGGALSDEDWQWVILEDRYYPDQLIAFWPETGRGIDAEPYVPDGDTGGPQKFGFRLPPDSPMSANSPLEGEVHSGDGRVRTRVCFLCDHTIEVARDQGGGSSGKIVDAAFGPVGVRKTPMYPNKRMVAEAAGQVLADGNNPTPRGKFPVVPIYALPPLTNFYPPPPARFTKDLQNLAGKMLTQTFENAVRLNNGVWFINESTGINTEAFGGIPGEVQVINSNSQPPQIVWPTAMPEHMTKLPMMLLDLQKELQGFSNSRGGAPGAGNISPELFEASIFQSKAITRCRERLLARSVHKVADQLFDLMTTYYQRKRNFASMSDDTLQSIPWLPMQDDSSLGTYVDPDSLLPISRSALRTIAPGLRAAGALDIRSFLRAIEYPDAEAVADKMENEMRLTALAKVRKR